MSIQKYLQDMALIQENILNFLDNQANSEANYKNLLNLFDEQQIHDNHPKLESLFYLLLKIANNHHRDVNFFDKIEQILNFFKNDMKKHFTNSELYNIFKSNKRILLYLFEENLLTMNKFIFKQMITYKNLYLKFAQYFIPEIKTILNEPWFPNHIEIDDNNNLVDILKDELPENYLEKRKIGVNHNEICELIQKDLIDEFIVYINKMNLPLDSKIPFSIYETNNFLLKNCDKNKLIDYAAFYGSNKIFCYLKYNGAQIDSQLWIYAIHGENAEIISFLDDSKINPKNYEDCLKESIKCHHHDITEYIQCNFLLDEIIANKLIYNIKYHNFDFQQKDIMNENMFCYLCQYNYVELVNLLLKETDIDINSKRIFINKYIHSVLMK